MAHSSFRYAADTGVGSPLHHLHRKDKYIEESRPPCDGAYQQGCAGGDPACA